MATTLFPAASRAVAAGGRIFTRRSSIGVRPASAVATFRGFHDATRARVQLEVRTRRKTCCALISIHDLFPNRRTVGCCRLYRVIHPVKAMHHRDIDY